MNNFENKILSFCVALQDVYKDEEDKESLAMPKLELKEETLTEDFTAMLYAMRVLYSEITGDNCDIIGFTHICNRLALQHIMEEKGVELD